nr:family 16 glycosylhydrolase [Lachnospiraceae bacterium]
GDGDLQGGTVTISGLKFKEVKNDAGTIEIPKGPEYDFNDNSGDFADPGLDKAGYTLVWNDEFDGNYGEASVDPNTGLNLDKWAYQLGDGSTDCGNYGWGNSELQAYTKEKKNISVNEDLTGDGVADGFLRITGSYEEKGYVYGNESSKRYTSGRIRTTSPSGELFNLTYGYIEARIALPGTRGAWPAFWMLPESTEIYGGWPVSGELDIMETTAAMINEGKACGTLHWGTPSHVYKGSGYVALDSTLNYFHTYGVDWKPGQITWYFDGKPVYTSTNWESAISGASGSLAFDAPFDQPFYMILNLAIDSGNFGGKDNKANFTGDINMYVDYVRAYQLTEGYADSAVREAQGTLDNWEEYAGIDQIAPILSDNLVATTGGHDDNGAAGSGKWYLSTQTDADAAAEVFTDNNGKVWHKVSVLKAGGKDYSVQLIGHYDAKKGYIYKVSFDAFAAGELVGKSVNCDSKEYATWGTYGIQDFVLQKKATSYFFTVQQTEDFDNCRIEFNLGGAGTGDVYISNVKVEIADPALMGESETGRNPLADGNLVYNSTFDQGNHKLGYWNAGYKTTVTVPRYTTKALAPDDVRVIDIASKNNYEAIRDGVKYYERRANISAEAGIAPVLYQAGITMAADEYTVNFDLYSETATAVKVSLVDASGAETVSKTVSYDPSEGLRNITVSLNAERDLGEGILKFTFAKGTTVQLDNVTMYGKHQGPSIDEKPVGGEKEITWRGDNGGGGELPLDKDGDALKLSNIVSGGNWYSPQIGSSNFAVSAGVKYRFSYKYKTDLTKHKYIVQQNGGSWIPVTDVIEVTTDVTTADEDGFYSYVTEFVSNVTLSDCHLNFGFGDSGANGNYFLFKDVELSIVKAEVPVGEASDDEVDDSLFENDNETASAEENNGNEGTTPVSGGSSAPAGGNTAPAGENTAPAAGGSDNTPAANTPAANPGNTPSGRQSRVTTERPGRDEQDNTETEDEEAETETETENGDEVIEDENAPLADAPATEEKTEESEEPEQASEPEESIADEEVALAASVSEEKSAPYGALIAVIGVIAALCAGAYAFFRFRKKA